MALSSHWIEKIFARMLVRYGAAWLRKYPGLEVDAVKADWALVLAPYEDNAKALYHGLGNLPDDAPPNAKEFARICRGVPQVAVPRLGAPVSGPDRRREVVKKVREAFAQRPNPKRAQLQRLLDIQAQGKKLTLLQLNMLRELQAQEAQS